MGADIHPIVSEELAELERVLERLQSLTPAAESGDAPLVQDLERLREMLIAREDTKDVAALSDQWHRQSSILRQLRSGRPARRVDPGSPYFAHLRLDEAGEDRDLFLGRATCLDAGLRIVDWRDAPISKIFYRYAQGEEYEEQIAGRRRQGHVLARRMVGIHDGRLDRVQAPEGDFVRDDGRWTQRTHAPAELRGADAASVHVHAAAERTPARLHPSVGAAPAHADKRLAEITGLIDPDQFELITRSAGFLVIRGAAGSGKTTVALHRVAYLAFDDPSIDSSDTLVVMFSEALRRYVSHVLPSLGIEQVAVRTYRDWARAERQRHFRELPTAHRNDTPSDVQRIKLHPALGSALAEHVARTPGPRTWRQAVDDWAAACTQRAGLESALARSKGAAVSTRQLDEFIAWNQQLIADVYAQLDGELESDEKLRLDPEDDALLLRAFQLRVGGLMGRRKKRLRYRHIVIDEAQDFSPLEVQVLLGCLDRDASITLAGDTQQHIAAQGGFSSWSEFFEQLGIGGAEVQTLRVSYRSTHEIMSFALAVLGPLREPDELPQTLRSGPPVELFEFADVGACVAFLADALRALELREPLASVALLAPTAASADTYHRALERADLRRLRRIRAGEFPFAPGIEVTEVEQAKGLEFDYVVLLDVSPGAYPEGAQERRLLHVGATRAVHQLWLTTAARVSPIVRSVLQPR